MATDLTHLRQCVIWHSDWGGGGQQNWLATEWYGNWPTTVATGMTPPRLTVTGTQAIQGKKDGLIPDNSAKVNKVWQNQFSQDWPWHNYTDSGETKATSLRQWHDSSSGGDNGKHNDCTWQWHDSSSGGDNGKHNDCTWQWRDSDSGPTVANAMTVHDSDVTVILGQHWQRQLLYMTVAWEWFRDNSGNQAWLNMILHDSDTRTTGIPHLGCTFFNR